MEHADAIGAYTEEEYQAHLTNIANLIAERDSLAAQLNELVQQNEELQAKIDSGTVAQDASQIETVNEYKLIDGKFAVRLGYWEAQRSFIKSIAVAAYGDTNIFKVETLASTGIYVDASTIVVANKCFYTGVCLWTNYDETSKIRVTTDNGIYELEVYFGADFVNNYDGMQYQWATFKAFYADLNTDL